MSLGIFHDPGDLYDIASIFIHCQTDKSALLVLETDGFEEYWLPCVGLAPLLFFEQYNDILRNIFGVVTPFSRMIYLSKVFIPNHRTRYLNHACFEVPINSDMKKRTRNTSGRFKDRLRWVSDEELIVLYVTRHLKSPELMQIYCNALNITNQSLSFTFATGYANFVNFVEVTDNILITSRSTNYEQLVVAANIDRYVQEVLLRDFWYRCFPMIYMSYGCFNQMMVRLGWEEDEIPHLFRSADITNRNALSYRELVFVLAATEPGPVFAGSNAELRCRYLFRYLDQEKRSLLRRDDLKRFLILVKKNKNLPIDVKKLDIELVDMYKVMKIGENVPLNIQQFLTHVGELRIRGTSMIYRSKVSIRRYIVDCLKAVTDVLSFDKKDEIDIPEYKLATHCVTLAKDRKSVQIDEIATFTFQASNIANSGRLDTCFGNELIRTNSFDAFNSKSPANVLARIVRYLIKLHKNVNVYARLDSFKYNWGEIDVPGIVNYFKEICVKVKKNVQKEPRLLQIKSPVYVMGDLHGNIRDLLTFEKSLWPLGVNLCPSNLLFLGDYVDRGVFSVEVMMYLFAYKAQNPTKIFLIRGNHEIRKIQQQWTFPVECRQKFGDKFGPVIFDAINEVFDCLPLAAVIDGTVFCCHGGIPTPWLCPSAIAINDIPIVLSNPADQSSLAWELMWNDPVKNGQLNEFMAMELMANEGFAVNQVRGTGHVYTSEALEKFLSTNCFSHFIRAHEMQEPGFRIAQKGKSITVFSSSKYCNGKNEAACLMADKGRLRIFRINTDLSI